MKVLIVSPATPNLLHRMRLHTLIKALSTDHQITLVSLNIGELKYTKYPKVKSYTYGKSKLSSFVDAFSTFPSLEPLEVGYCKSNSVSAKVKEILETQDVVIVKRLRAIQYLPKNISAPVILDTTDAMSLFYKRGFQNVAWWKKPLYAEEYIKYRQYEYKTSKKIKNWIVCSKDDTSYLRTVLSKDVIFHHVPNVVDTDYFKPISTKIKSDLLFSGLMDKPINYQSAIYFINNVLPIIRSAFPNIKLDIVGPKPPRRLKILQSNNVKIIGRVDDLRPFIANSKVIIAPVVFGTGSSFKVVQSWSMGKPVVSTSIGARELIYKNGKEIFVTDDTNKFAQHVVSILTNEALGRRIGNHARKNVIRNYSIKTMREKYNAVINSTINK